MTRETNLNFDVHIKFQELRVNQKQIQLEITLKHDIEGLNPVKHTAIMDLGDLVTANFKVNVITT